MITTESTEPPAIAEWFPSPLYRIVNLVDHQIEVYSGPQADGYASRVDFKSGDRVPVVVGGTIVGQIAVDDIIS